MTPTAQDAVKLAARGFRVFPLIVGGKRPMFKGWKESATADAFTILETWPRNGCNIGVATGRGIMVIDVDAHRDGLKHLAGLNLPATFTVRTASGGLHLYFTVPLDTRIPNSVDKLAPGIDVRGEGGYVVGPGSIVGVNAYGIEREFPS